MTRINHDAVGERRFETGVDHGVLYPSDDGVYPLGVAWNGLTAVTESPSGAEATPIYADNIKYVVLQSAEEFTGTIEALSSPVEFDQCDGTATFHGGVSIGGQTRKSFGFGWRTKVGTDTNPDAGYKQHLAYGLLAAPSEKPHNTVNDSPEATTFSWEVTSTPVAVGVIDGKEYKPTSTVTVDSTRVPVDAWNALQDILLGTEGGDPYLPLPADVIAMFEGSLTEVTALAPTYNSSTDVLTVPTVTGVEYLIDGEVVTGSVTLTEDTVVTARPTSGHKLANLSDNDWYFDFS